MPKPGDIILTRVQFTDTFEIKTRPALILFEEFGNYVVAGITSNTEMQGISLTKKEGLPKDSVIKLNYLFTISSVMIKKKFISLSQQKKNLVHKELLKKLDTLS